MFKKTATAVILAAAAMLASAGPSAAQGMGRGPVASACAAEINRYCANLSHGGGAVRACLQAKRGKLSATCRNALDGTGYGRRWR
jgi:hypothetical protein